MRDLLKRRVLDHAVIRYLERVEGLDIEAIRNKIWSLAHEGMLLRKNREITTHYHPETGVVIIMANSSVIVTVLGPEQYKPKP